MGAACIGLNHVCLVDRTMNDFAKGQPLIDCTLKVYVMEDRSPTLDIICKRCRSVYYNFIGRRVCDLIVIKLNRLQYEERNFQ